MSDQNQELVKVQEVAALFVNRFQVVVSGDLTRITFGEAVVGTDATYRTAVILRTADALSLANILRTSAEQIFAQVNIAEEPDSLSAEAKLGDG